MATTLATATVVDATASGEATTEAPVETTGPEASTGAPSTGEPPPTTGTSGPGCDPSGIDCGGTVFGCVDGLDNDGDGLFDLDDPECLSPCDDDEGEFRPGIPTDNYSCSLDCAFDLNTGHGDDLCFYDRGCDPLEPDPDTCPAADPLACVDQPMVTEQCLSFCPPVVPNGCDCFGCCAFEVEGVVEHHAVYEGRWSGCSAADLGACPACTPQMELCGNPCEVEACEVCIGQTGPPEGCEAAGCVGATACEGHCDCARGEYCHTGCCHPLPVG